MATCDGDNYDEYRKGNKQKYNKSNPHQYQPIENYGVIGNMHTVALVSRHRASIDFFCYPDFDSPTVFARLLDYEKGGFFEITPTINISLHHRQKYHYFFTKGTLSENVASSSTATYSKFDSSSAAKGPVSCESADYLKSKIRTKQLYLPSSNILVTRSSGKEGISQVTDLMPVRSNGSPSVPWLVRKLECIRGMAMMEVSIMPAFDYARSGHLLKICHIHNRILFSSRFMSMDLRWASPSNPGTELCAMDNSCPITPRSSACWKKFGDPHRPGASAFFSLVEGQSLVFALRQVHLKGIFLKAIEKPISCSTEKPVILDSSHEPKSTSWPNMCPKTASHRSSVLSAKFITNNDHMELFQEQYKESIDKDKQLSNDLLLNDTDSLGYDFVCGLIGETLSFWHSWIAGCSYTGRWRENVHRSALLLKLLTYAPTGAIIAAPTFGLPEEIGGMLNWDYRFTWIRDAAFTVYAFLRIGFKQEALAFMEFIEKKCKEIDPSQGIHLQVLYDIRGNSPEKMIQDVKSRSSWYVTEHNSSISYEVAKDIGKGSAEEQYLLHRDNDQMRTNSIIGALNSLYLISTEHEMTLDYLDGYCSSRPVRIGNAACNQTQSDIYGELMDAIYLVDKWARPISYDFWSFIRNTLVPQVLHSSKLPDHGIWELRHGQRHYTYSKVMSWVALDRAVRLAAKRSFPSDADKVWRPARDALFEEVMQKGWSEERQAFVQYYGSTDLDASSLVMPLVLFLSPMDPKFLKTLEQMLKPTRVGGLTANNLCFRWSPWLPAASPSSMIVTMQPTEPTSLSSSEKTESSDVYTDPDNVQLDSISNESAKDFPPGSMNNIINQNTKPFRPFESTNTKLNFLTEDKNYEQFILNAKDDEINNHSLSQVETVFDTGVVNSSNDSSSSVASMGSTTILRNEGTFNLCSFWLVEAMARAGSKMIIKESHNNQNYLDHAVLKFEDIIGYANHLGLFSEEISVSGEALGNFPQAFTHLALISAAFNIDRQLDEKQ